MTYKHLLEPESDLCQPEKGTVRRALHSAVFSQIVHLETWCPRHYSSRKLQIRQHEELEDVACSAAALFSKEQIEDCKILQTLSNDPCWMVSSLGNSTEFSGAFG